MLACLSLVVLASVASAQQEEPGGRFLLGPISFTPYITVNNVGVDSNVFNEADNPKRDTTATVGPAVNLWARLGRARLTGKAGVQYVYYKVYDSQRSFNTSDEGRIQLPMGRFTPYVGGSYAVTSDRSGFEIDSRSQRNDSMLRLGSLVRLSGRTTLDLGAARSENRYDRNDPTYGTQLSNALDRRIEDEQLRLSYALTPLTTFVVQVDAQQDRFTFNPDRNTDSVRVMPGFELKPLALIAGTAYVGFRHFNGLRDSLPDYNLLVANTDITYRLAATRIVLHVARDVNFSVQSETPVYVSTDVGLSVTQRITRTWDIVGRYGYQWLGYRGAIVDVVETGGHTDRNRQVGGGLGYMVGRTLRVGLDANYYRRRTVVNEQRNYEGLRVGASVTYGLPQ